MNNLKPLSGSLFSPGETTQNVSRLHTEEMTTGEKLKSLQRKLRDAMGADYDPVLELAKLAQECIQEGDRKTAITALNGVADRLYPKLKAYEVTDNSDVPLVIENSSAAQQSKPVSGAKRFPFE